MATSKAQILAVAKYRKEKCDNISIDVPKGKKASYRQSAAELNLNLTALIQNAVEEFIARHSGENQATLSSPPLKLSVVEKNLLAEFNQLPVDTQKLILKLIHTLNEKNHAVNNS